MRPRANRCPPRQAVRPLVSVAAPVAAIWSAWSLPHRSTHSRNRALAVNPACTRVAKVPAPQMLPPRKMPMSSTVAATAPAPTPMRCAIKGEFTWDCITWGGNSSASIGFECFEHNHRQSAPLGGSIWRQPVGGRQWRRRRLSSLGLTTIWTTLRWGWWKVKLDRVNRKRVKNYNYVRVYSKISQFIQTKLDSSDGGSQFYKSFILLVKFFDQTIR